MSDLTTTQIFATGEKNITATKMNNIIGGAVIQPDFYASKPTASSVNPTDQLLILSGGAYAQAPFSTVVNSVGSSMGPQITAVRLRSFNSLSNPTFEVDQRNIGNLVTNPASGTLLQDRWSIVRAGTMAVNTQQLAGQQVLLPGTNFRLSSRALSITLTTQETTLGAGDHLEIAQIIEGPRWRELSLDVHSISLLVYTSVAGLKFSVAIRDNPPTQSLVKLCTVPSANTWTLIQLPSLPVWPAGNFNASSGVPGYELRVCLAAGTTFTAPAADIFQSGNFTGAPGMDNFMSKPVNSVFNLGFVQHEPGSQSTTPIDCPFGQNYDGDFGCLRYYCKSYEYGTKAPTNTSVGVVSAMTGANATFALGTIPFSKTMAKTPTLTVYAIDGTANAVLQLGAGGNVSVNSILGLGTKGFYGVGFPSAVTVNQPCQMHYAADSGW